MSLVPRGPIVDDREPGKTDSQFVVLQRSARDLWPRKNFNRASPIGRQGRRPLPIEYRAREQNEGEFYLAGVLPKASCNLGRGESGKVYHWLRSPHTRCLDATCRDISRFSLREIPTARPITANRIGFLFVRQIKSRRCSSHSRFFERRRRKNQVSPAGEIDIFKKTPPPPSGLGEWIPLSSITNAAIALQRARSPIFRMRSNINLGDTGH